MFSPDGLRLLNMHDFLLVLQLERVTYEAGCAWL